MTDKYSVMQELSRGGEWLGGARTWLQSNVRRGDALPWSSGEPVTIPFCKFEEFALTVAATAVAEDRRQMQGPGTPTHRFLALMAELEKRFPHPNPFDSTKAPEQYVLEAIDKLLGQNDVNLPRGWQIWTGHGDHPTGDTLVLFKMMDGDMTDETQPTRAGDLDWSRSTFRQPDDWEIVAYKVVTR